MHISTKTLVIFLLLFPATAGAATAVVKVDVGAEYANALEGAVVLPADIGIRDIQTGNSAILFWIAPPKHDGRVITFAGITPGGFTGVQPVFSIRGDFSASDLGGVRFESVRALANDGSGARVPAVLSLSVAQFKADVEPPDDFTPVVASDPSLLDGKYFLVFATQDKGTGIDRYEVREGRWGFFREAESPYPLTHQKLNRAIYVKAIDNAGNERIVSIPAQIRSAWWERYGLFAILMVFACIALAYKKTWIRFIK